MDGSRFRTFNGPGHQEFHTEGLVVTVVVVRDPQRTFTFVQGSVPDDPRKVHQDNERSQTLGDEIRREREDVKDSLFV